MSARHLMEGAEGFLNLSSIFLQLPWRKGREERNSRWAAEAPAESSYFPELP